MSWLTEIWQALRAPRPEPPYNSEYQAAWDWYSRFSPKDVDYSRIKDASNERYEELLENHATIDAKAEWVFGVALAAVGAIFAVVIPWNLPLISVVPTLAAFLTAMLATIRCRVPNKRPMPMGLKKMVDVLEHEPAGMDGILIASTHCAIEGLKHVNTWKSAQVLAAARSLVIGTVLIAIPLAYHETQSPSSPAENRSQPVQSAQDARKEDRLEWSWEWDWTRQPTIPENRQTHEVTKQNQP